MKATRRGLMAGVAASLVVWPRSTFAVEIPTLSMDCLALLSRWIVLATERASASVPTVDGARVTVRTCEVDSVFRGDLPIGATIEVELDPTYVTALLDDDWKDQQIPLGEVVLFLERQEVTTDRFVPVLGGVKPIVDGVVHCYGQFVGNPGALVLAPQVPERVAPAGPYDRAAFFADLTAQLSHSVAIGRPERHRPDACGTRSPRWRSRPRSP